MEKEGIQFRPGSDCYIYGVAYDDEFSEMEIYPKYGGIWWGVPMSKATADRLICKLKTHGVFFIENVRHVLVDD